MDDGRLSKDEFSKDEIIQAFNTVAKQAIRATGGSEMWHGETKEFLRNFENLVALVDGKTYQPKKIDALDELTRVDDILERVAGTLSVEFSAIAAGLKPEDNPITQTEWMQDCNTDLQSSIRGLRKTMQPERPIQDENWQHRQTGRDLGL
jgi:hypothetical protein